MKILSVNAGSSSLKFTLFEMPEEKELISGVFEKIGIKDSFYTVKIDGEKIKKEVNLPSHKEAFEILMKELIDNKIIEDYSEIKGIGHRVAQGGAYFDKSVLATDENIEIVSLIKPQFEAEREEVGKNGVIREEKTHLKVINKIFDFIPEIGLYPKGLTYSPIKGPKGNIEYLLYLSDKPSDFKTEISEIVKEAFETL